MIMKFFVFLLSLVFILVGCSSVMTIPSNANLYQTVPILCSNGMLHLLFYDTDLAPENGAEILQVYDPQTGKTLGTAYFSPGADGEFIQAVVGDEVFKNVEELNSKYSSPCSLPRIQNT